MKLDILAIAAHPDDVELTCGGTLLKMAQKGYKTGILDLTAGEMGTRGTPETRAKEAALAAKILKVSWRGNLGVPDSDVQPTRQNKMRLAQLIRDLRPQTVILPYWEARHPDHYHASTLGYEGCFLAGLKRLPLTGEPHRPFKILYATSFEGMPAINPGSARSRRTSGHALGASKASTEIACRMRHSTSHREPSKAAITLAVTCE